MSRTYLMWVVAAFLGASVVFRLLLDLTDDSSAWVRYGLQLLALVVLVAGAVFAVSRFGDRDADSDKDAPG